MGAIEGVKTAFHLAMKSAFLSSSLMSTADRHASLDILMVSFQTASMGWSITNSAV